MRQIKKDHCVIRKRILLLPLLLLGLLAFSCDKATSDSASNSTVNPTSIPAANRAVPTKISSLLQLQIDLRKAQLASPTPERLSQMQAQGMNVTNIGIQRIFIYLNQDLTPSQITDLQSLGVTLYLDSWIPPLANHPTGYLLADIPVNVIDDLIVINFIVRLDTAEVRSKPQF
jgi:hypothetical protein